MPAALLIIPALIIGTVLIVSGALKIRTPSDVAELEALGLPAPLRASWLVRLHPWAEIALGLALVLLGGVLGVLAALAATTLLACYLVLVARALRVRPGSTCACFGAARPITGRTVVRNAWLTAVALVALVMSGRTPLWGGPLLALDAEGWLWVLGAAAAAVTTLLTALPDARNSQTSDAVMPVPPASEDDLDYIRSRTPAIPVTLADGTTDTLRAISARRPLLTLAVSAGCGSCTSVLERVPGWRALLPEVEIRLIMQSLPDESEITEFEEPQSLHDPDWLVGESIGYQGTPTAVLYGLDGMLAGGPVTGSIAVEGFIADVYESLHGERPQADA